jgi:hypothetical protein
MMSDRHYPGEPVFPDLAVIGRIETEVARNGKIEYETRYYLCSLAAPPSDGERGPVRGPVLVALEGTVGPDGPFGHTVLSIDDALHFIAHEDVLWVMT